VVAEVLSEPQPDTVMAQLDTEAPKPAPTAAMGGAFTQEANARTHEKPEAEEVFAAFTDAKLPLSEIKQGLGSTSFAQYCVFGTSAVGARVVLCEYQDVVAATAALPKVRALLTDQRRRVEAHGRLMLTVLLAGDGPDAERERDAFFATFASVYAAH